MAANAGETKVKLWEGIPMRSAGISTSDRERTGIREGALFSCRICRMYGVYGLPACWYAGLLYL